jgi:hypothetical protein
MQQVADWLEKLGLGQYAQRFAENDISFSVLPDLTDQHLKEIGVSLGHASNYCARSLNSRAAIKRLRRPLLRLQNLLPHRTPQSAAKSPLGCGTDN